MNSAPCLGVHDEDATPFIAHPDVVPPDTETGGVGMRSYADWNLDLQVHVHIHPQSE